MSTRLNPPPGWPPVPPGWAPPPGWQPDPSWPDPPPGWNLWTEAPPWRDRLNHAARWVIAGGGAVLLGSLLPFLSSSQPDLYPVNSSPKETATFFGIVLVALGVIMMAKSRRANLIAGILAFIVAGLTALTLMGLIVAGIVGTDEPGILGSVHVNFSPQAGIFISILGCVAAGIGGIMSFTANGKQIPDDRKRGPAVA